MSKYKELMNSLYQFMSLMNFLFRDKEIKKEGNKQVFVPRTGLLMTFYENNIVNFFVYLKECHTFAHY